MIKNNQHIFNKIQVLIDAVMIVCAYVLAWHLRFQGDLFVQDAGVLSKKVYMSVLFYIVPIYLILYYICQLYTPRRSMSRRKEVWNIFRANCIGITGFILILYLVKQEDFSRQMLFMFWGLNILMEIMSRYAIRYVLWNMRKYGFNQKHILMIGSSGATVQYLERIKSNPHWGYQVIGILTNIFVECETICGVSVIGKIDELQTVLEQHKLDEIVITLGMEEANQLEIIVDMCERYGVHTKFIPDYGNVIPTRPHIEDVQGIPVINIRNVPLKQAPNYWIKRIIDVIGALFAIIIFSPIMLVTAIIVRITMEGSVIFKQKRVGLQGKEFCMYKFRSMIVQDAESEKKAWSQANDPRITPVGRVIRRTSIDELPQLFNVLKGEMSLVGPRPERPQFVEKFKNEIPRYMIKHQVRPGMTGWAQVNGYRGDTSIKKRIEHDLYYIENWSLGLDMKILIMTFFKGFSV